MTDYKPGDKIKFGNQHYIVEKLAPGKILLRGFGFRKWFPIEEVNKIAKMEKLK